MFNKEYYETHLGPVPCFPGVPEWEEHFRKIAQHIVGSLSPRSVIDVGCSFGMLVRHFENMGVHAVGFDVSKYAISESVSRNCRIGDIRTFYDKWKYGIAVCIEVFEHIPDADIEKALKRLCRLSDTILFSATPNDTSEVTHITVRPREWWDKQFERQGFYADPFYDADFVVAHARLYRRKH
jgi:2-polyprenyl-3-methyl-5-hydroxy-6-metoxy-1,4-benzoquinol methylase